MYPSRFLILWLALALHDAQGQVSPSAHAAYFYRSLPYGSEAAFNPISLVVNGGLDELQSYGRQDAFDRISWDAGATNVWRNISDPFPQIRLYGTNRYVASELIPTSLNKERGQWFPNYMNHLFGGGMEYRKTAEWYEANGFPSPYVLSAVTTMTYHYVNEVVENGSYVGSNVDPISDLLVFDPLGIILFSFDDVADFFSSTFSFNDWSSQPGVSFGPFSGRNIGQNFVVKYPVTVSRRTSLFYHFGNFGLLGASIKIDPQESVSFGVGVVSKDVYRLGLDVLAQSIHTGYMAGVYYDRNNSLLASLVVMDSRKDLVRLNVFPGVVSIAGFSPGFFAVVGNGGTLSAGFTARFVPIGIGMYRPN